MSPPSRLPASDGRFHTLDGLRGMAALAVAAFHFGYTKTQWVPNGYLAVDFFLMLSGFVIARNYVPAMVRGLSPGRFVLLRAVRLYPLFLLGILMGLAIKSVYRFKDGMQPGDGDLFISFLFNLAVLPSPIDEHLFPLNVPSWSLFMEALINLLFAWLLFRLSPRALLLVTALGLAALLVAIGPPLYFEAGVGWDNIDGGLARTLFAFPLGMWFHYATARIRRAPSGPWALVAIALLCLMFVLPIEARFGPAMHNVFEYVVVLLVCPLVLLLGIRFEPPACLRRTFGLLGDISYPLYATHHPLLSASTSIGKRAALPEYVQMGLFLAGAMAFAWLAARFYDGPLRARLTRRFHLRRSAEPQVVGEAARHGGA